MKLDPLFTIKNNKLYKLADDSEVALDGLKKIELPWSKLELEPEHYNEELLAKLRDDLKAMEESGEFAIIVPVTDREIAAADEDYDETSYITACNHAARRIKDCTSVVGFEIPAEIEDQEDFVNTLSKKHGQYIYFRKESTKGDNTMEDRIITY